LPESHFRGSFGAVTEAVDEMRSSSTAIRRLSEPTGNQTAIKCRDHSSRLRIFKILYERFSEPRQIVGK